MRAVVHDRYGPPEVLHLAEVERPTPATGEVLVRVRATTVNRTDCGFRRPTPFFVRLFSGLRRPKHRILGTEFAGEVDAVGPDVSRFRAGDRVFGLNADRFGAHAEYVCVREDAPMAAMPAGLSFEEAAALPDGALIALACLRRAGLRDGQRLLVYGASGSIGTAAVQLARHLGARVTAVCPTVALDTVRSLGADEVIDYTKEDFLHPGDAYDVIFDAVGKISFWRCRRALEPRGIYLDTDLGPGWQNPLLHLVTSHLGRRQALLPIPRPSQEDVHWLRDLVEAGRYRAVIDRRYPLEEIVSATRYVETERKVGSVVLTVP